MLPLEQPDRIHVAFDDHRLVANAGLLLPVTLARHLGLGELVDRHVDLGGAPGRANVGDKMLTLVASALAGGDCIDDADALRAGGTDRVLGCVIKAPSTLGTFLRCHCSGIDIRPTRIDGDMPACAVSAGNSAVCTRWYRLRMYSVPITLGDIRRDHSVGSRNHFCHSSECHASWDSSSYTARYFGPPCTASYRAASSTHGIDNRSGMCSSLYQRLYSLSFSGATSLYTSSSPSPFLFVAMSPPCPIIWIVAEYITATPESSLPLLWWKQVGVRIVPLAGGVSQSSIPNLPRNCTRPLISSWHLSGQ